jgi:hypothetical protein
MIGILNICFDVLEFFGVVHYSACIGVGFLKIGMQCTQRNQVFQLFPLRHSDSLGCRHRT